MAVERVDPGGPADHAGLRAGDRIVSPVEKLYNFPGNVRELEAMVFDAVARHNGAVLSLQSFRETIGAGAVDVEPESGASPNGWTFPQAAAHVDQAEEALIDEALTRADGNQGIAAGLLGISRQALNKRLHCRVRA